MTEIDEDVLAELNELDEQIESEDDEVSRIKNEIESIDLSRKQFCEAMEKRQKKRAKLQRKRSAFVKKHKITLSDEE